MASLVADALRFTADLLLLAFTGLAFVAVLCVGAVLVVSTYHAVRRPR